MNFIDKAFESKLSGDDFLQAMSDVYSEPEVREILDKYPQFVKDVILIMNKNLYPPFEMGAEAKP